MKTKMVNLITLILYKVSMSFHTKKDIVIHFISESEHCVPTFLSVHIIAMVSHQFFNPPRPLYCISSTQYNF